MNLSPLSPTLTPMGVSGKVQNVPANALLDEDGNPILDEDGNYILTEG